MTSKRELTPDYIGHIGGAALIALSQGTTSTPETLESIEKKLTTINYVWNPATLVYDVMTQPGASTGAAGGSTTVDANLTSAGSTKLVGIVQVSNPTTSVTVSNPTTSVSLSAGSSSNMVGAVAVSNPTTSVSLSSQHTVTADLSSVGSTKLAGQFTVANPTTSVTVSSGVILGAGSSANTIGSVANVAGSSATLIGAVAVSSGVVLGAGSSANVLGSVTLAAGTTANSLGSVALLAGTSANIIGTVVNAAGGSTIGSVQQGLGSSANFWFVQSIAFSSGGTARTSVSTTVDIQIIAANASRKALVVSNRSTVQTVGLGYSTAVLTTALANVDLFLPVSGQLSFGLAGGLPLFTGPMRGINLSSTTVAGSVSVIEFT